MLNCLLTYFKSLRYKNEGQGMVEYGLIIALIAVVVVGALIVLGPQIAQLFTEVGANLPPVGGGEGEVLP